MATTRSSSTNQPGSNTAPSTDSWRTTIDGWIREPAIRNFGLTTLIVTVGGLALTVGLASGAVAVIMNAVLPNLLSKLLAAATLSTLGGSAWAIKRRRRRQQRTTTTHSAEQRNA